MLTIILCILLLVMAVFLTIAVLMQHGKSHNLSGTIAGGAETFFGKTKGRSVDAMLSKLTTIVAIVFVILVVIVYIMQPNELEYADDSAGTVTDNGTVESTTDNTEADGTEANDAAEGDQTPDASGDEVADNTTEQPDAEGENNTEASVEDSTTAE